MASTLIKHSVSLYNSSMDKKKKDIESRDNSFISLSPSTVIAIVQCSH